jgi:hypothetical protein
MEIKVILQEYAAEINEFIIVPTLLRGNTIAPTGLPEYADATVYKIWAIAFGTAGQPGRLYAGTIPGGLFVSDDGGESWQLNRPLWNHESQRYSQFPVRIHKSMGSG